ATLAALWARKRPYLAVGWLWYLGTLVPVIGLVQVGGQEMADRYSYVPSIGLFIAVVFGLSDLPGRAARLLAPALAAVALSVCLLITHRQLLFWHDSEALYRHMIAVTQDNFAGYNNLGCVLFNQGKNEEAARCYGEALRCKPDYADAHCNLGIAYGALNRLPEARAELLAALRYGPKSSRTHYFLGNRLLADGDLPGAAEHYRRAAELRDDNAEAHYQLAVVCEAQGDIAAAIGEFREAIRLNPSWVEALNNLAWLLATHPDTRFRNGTEAVDLASRAVTLTQTNQAGSLDTLAGALAEAGRFAEAVSTAQNAARLAQSQTNAALAGEIQAHVDVLKQHKPLREQPTASAAAAINPPRPTL
ncbi:MAG TPA: tetratricopeptide repeat protein, partial [Candidatus Acidoferrum sp.]|nr:tetratricopeptide repeat protein [Candidatus Acidoferrum sp.]